MPYDLLPGVDESFRFPPEVQKANGVVALTTAQRDAIPAALLYTGRMIYNLTVNRYERYNGASWGSQLEDLLITSGTPSPIATSGSRGISTSAARADHAHAAPSWTTWVPSFVAGGVNGNATRSGRYVEIGKTVHFWGKMTLGSTSSVPVGVPIIAVPVPPANPMGQISGTITDAGNTFYDVLMLLGGAGVSIYGTVANGAAQGSLPFTLGNTDVIDYWGTYERV